MFEFIDYICNILEIEKPSIKLSSTKLNNDTMLAMISPCENILYIKDNIRGMDQLFSIAHELRHLWQFKTDKEYFFSNYMGVEDANSIDEYNLQIAEIDANAFAEIVITDLYGVKPLYRGLSNQVKQRIMDRIGELVKIGLTQK